MSLQELKSQFDHKFLSLIHVRNRYEVFRDWAYIAAITCHQAPVNMGILTKDEIYEQLENLYLEKVKNYDRESLEVFAQMLGILQLAFSDEKTDFLGQLHHELSIGWNKDKGQFFTPPEQGTDTCQETESFDISPRQLNLFDQEPEPSSSPIDLNRNPKEDNQLDLFEDL